MNVFRRNLYLLLIAALPCFSMPAQEGKAAATDPKAAEILNSARDAASTARASAEEQKRKIDAELGTKMETLLTQTTARLEKRIEDIRAGASSAEEKFKAESEIREIMSRLGSLLANDPAASPGAVEGKPEDATGKPESPGKPDGAGKPESPGKPDGNGAPQPKERDEVIQVVSNLPRAYTIGPIRKGEQLVLTYVSGTWRRGWKARDVSPDDPKADEEERLRLCDGEAEATRNQIKLVGDGTNKKSFVWTADRDYKDLFLRRNDHRMMSTDEKFGNIPNGDVKYRLQIRAPKK